MTIERSPKNLMKGAWQRKAKLKPGFSREVKAIVAARSGGLCEIGTHCGPAPAEHMHHRRPRGLGGTSLPWVNKAANALHLCAAHHAFVEEYRTLAQVEGWLISQHRKGVVAVDVPVLYRGRSVLLSDDGGVRPVGDGAA